MKRSSSNTAIPSGKKKRKSLRKSEINILDDQLAEIIFKFVPMCQWSSCLEYVSKQFRRCVINAYSRIKVVNLEMLFSLKLSRYKWEMDNQKLLFSIDKTTTVRLNNILNKLLSVCPNLADIAGFEYVACSLNAKSTWNILKKFDRLQSISFEAWEIKFKYFHDFIVGHKSLKNLKFSPFSFNGRGTLDVGSLTSIVCSSDSNDVLLENLSEKLTMLAIESFQCYFKSADYAEQAMKLCVNLESLSVYIDNMDDCKILSNVLPHLCKLTELRVAGWPNWLDANVLGEQFCVQLDTIKSQLKILEISRLKVCDELQRFLFTECLNLQSLKIIHISSLSINVLKKLFSLPSKLKELTFADDNGQILPLLLPNLVRLSNFTDLTVRGVFLSEEWENICCLVHLRNLRVYGGVIDDSLLEKWDKKNPKIFENLDTFVIPNCRGISDVGACLFAKKAKNLQILDLSASQIGDKTISILADVAKKLTVADLQYCDRLRDEKTFLDFIKRLVCLKKLLLEDWLAKKVVVHKDFVPFVEYVEIINV